MSRSHEGLSDVIIVEGPPGSGKGFLSTRYLAEHPATRHISAGQQVRGIRVGEIESVYSPIVLACLAAREYLPDDVFGGVVLEEMSKGGPEVGLTLVDGFPHNLGDFDYVQEKLGEVGKRILGAVCLDATLETCLYRMAYRGMRSGEDARREALFATTNSEEEYYKGRYVMYLQERSVLRDILDRRGLPSELVDVNPDILEEGGRRLVYGQFIQAIHNLRLTN